MSTRLNIETEKMSSVKIDSLTSYSYWGLW